MPKDNKNLGLISSGNGLLPDNTKPLSEPLLISMGLCGIHLRTISHEVLKSVLEVSISKTGFKIVPQRLLKISQGTMS